MKDLKVFQVKEEKLNQLKGGAALGGTTNTNCGTGFTQETKRDKDSAASCESSISAPTKVE